MKFTYKLVNNNRDNVNLEPWTNIPAKILSVEYIPSLGDPEDPDDEGEMILWLEVEE